MTKLMISPGSKPRDESQALEVFDLEKGDQQGQVSGDVPEEQISAADYDPSLDRREDEEKRMRAVVAKDEEHLDNGVIEVDDEEEDDVDDMFAMIDAEKPKKVKKVVVSDSKRQLLPFLTCASIEGFCTGAYTNDFGLSVRCGRLLPDHSRRTTRRWPISGLLISRERHVCQCCQSSCPSRRAK